jgi:hypothetical protein
MGKLTGKVKPEMSDQEPGNQGTITGIMKVYGSMIKIECT